MTNPSDFDPARDRYLNAKAFAAPSTFQLGNTARGLDWVRGFSQKSESLSLAKLIPISEKVRAVLRADAQNPFNFVRWNNPTTTITDAAFGKVLGSAAGRTIQLSATVRLQRGLSPKDAPNLPERSPKDAAKESTKVAQFI